MVRVPVNLLCIEEAQEDAADKVRSLLRAGKGPKRTCTAYCICIAVYFQRLHEKTWVGRFLSSSRIDCESWQASWVFGILRTSADGSLR